MTQDVEELPTYVLARQRYYPPLPRWVFARDVSCIVSVSSKAGAQVLKIQDSRQHLPLVQSEFDVRARRRAINSSYKCSIDHLKGASMAWKESDKTGHIYVALRLNPKASRHTLKMSYVFVNLGPYAHGSWPLSWEGKIDEA